MVDRFTDRFDPSTYAEDPKVLFRMGCHPRVEHVAPLETWLSERLLGRLRHLGLAFELPLLGRLPAGSGKWFYPEQQIEALADEIAFVLERVDDALLESAFASLTPLFRPRGRSWYGWSLMVEVA